MGLSISGLGSGLDTATIISQLMQAEAVPQSQLKSALSTNTVKAGAWTSLTTIVAAMRSKADALRTPAQASTTTATSSAPTRVGVSSSGQAAPAHLTFRVSQLASAQQLASSGVASRSTVVGASTTVVTSGHEAVGASSVTGGSATAGHTLVVTGTARSATATGSVPSAPAPAGTVLDVALGDGSSASVDLSGAPSGADDLRAWLQAQLTAAGAAVDVQVDGGRLTLRTTATGSAASLTVGGDGAAHLGLTPGTTRGSDTTVTADGGVVDLVDDGGGASHVALADGTTVRFAGPPRAGTLSIAVGVTTSATSTMSDVAAALSAAGGPARAALVDTGTGADPVRLVLSATATGSAGALRVSSDVAALAAPEELRAADDAKLVLGTGSSALTVTRSSNTVSDLVDGVTLTLQQADPAVDVTVDVARDDGALTSALQGLVESVNSTLSWIKTNSAYDVAKKTGGPMVGDNGPRTLASSVLSAMSTSTSGPYGTAGALGISIDRSGTYSLDTAKLAAAVKDDPAAVADLVARLSSAVGDVAKAAADDSGVLGVGRASTAARAKDLQARIDDWDTKLTAIQARYQTQFSALDVALSKLNAQKSWLSGQLSSLPSSSS